ncbi:MAG: molybdopterin molybdotransferase MoeA [Actinomycetota bacterium]|nr:molybdopterin molybdotransferase MoeA [Actinomycetota bacterium]
MMLSVDEARRRVLSAVHILDPMDVQVGRALGAVLAHDAFAPHALPRFDNSAMDGYAVIGTETARASQTSPVQLRIVGEVRAGDPGTQSVGPGTAARIMTGAPVPPGADAVVQVEETEERDGFVLVTGATSAGRNVRPAGDDVNEGDLVVPAGTELGPGEIALLASLGLSPAKVIRPPRVAVLVTGDELVPPETEPGPGQIRDSNSLALRALCASAGAEVVGFPPVPDRREATIDMFSAAAEASDLVVSSGGVAVGRYDFVKEAVEQLGQIEMWRVAMQPGKPVVLGSVKGTTFLGLPGNPVSIHVTFEQFVRPAIRKMHGCRSLMAPVVRATLTEDLSKKPGRMQFVRVRLRSTEEGWEATPTGPQGSHIQSSLVGCDGVARFAAEATKLPAGEIVEIELWRLPGEGDG